MAHGSHPNNSVESYVCRGLVCRITAATLFPYLNGLITGQSPRELCASSEYCTEPGKKDEQGLTGLKNTGCDICKLMVIKIDAALEDEKTEVCIKIKKINILKIKLINTFL